MKKILYVGNDLKHKFINTTVMRTLGPALEQEGYTVYYTSPKKNKVLRLLDMIISVLRYGRRVDVVFIDTYSTLNFYYALTVSWLAALFKLPYIPILHGGNLVTRIKSSPILAHRIFDNAHINISPSRFLYEAFKTHHYDNVIYVPNFLKIEQYPLVEKTYDRLNILWVRSLESMYNPKLALLVMKQLKESGYDARLCMVGPDRDGQKADLSGFARDHHLDVSFTGKLSKADWIDTSKDYNLFLNTTNIDNMPVSVIEAMALGFPIVSTNVGGLPYLIDQNENGILVQPNNIDAMTKAITELWTDKVRLKAMSAKARKTAETFDWHEVKAKWIAVLDEDHAVDTT